MKELDELKAKIALLEQQMQENAELKARLKEAQELNILSQFNPNEWVDNKTIVAEVYGAELPVLRQIILLWDLEVHLPYKRVRKTLKEDRFKDCGDQYLDRQGEKQSPLVRRGSDLHNALVEIVTHEYEAFKDALLSAVIRETSGLSPVKDED